MSIPCCASPPKAFCQEKVTTSSFSKIQRLRESRARRVADRQPGAVGGDPPAIRHPHARCGAVPGEHHVAGEIHLGEVGQLAVIRLDDPYVREAELLHHIRNPAGAKALPGEHVDAARAEQRPQRHFHRTCIGRGNDADAVVRRNAKDAAGLVDGFLEARLARLGAMRPAEQRTLKNLGGPARPLGGGAGGETRIAGLIAGCSSLLI
jgi:hypothetical protein